MSHKRANNDLANTIGKYIRRARTERGFSQDALATGSDLTQTHIYHFETGRRLPSIDQLLTIARVLKLPLQYFLRGEEQLNPSPTDIAFQFKSLGIVDLAIESSTAPVAFPPNEAIISQFLADEKPDARILEALPAVLAWNKWSIPLLRAHARTDGGDRILRRLGWLADIVLYVHSDFGFPGGTKSIRELQALRRGLSKANLVPPSAEWDDLGRPSPSEPTSAIWRRWKINCDLQLLDFMARADRLKGARERISRRARKTN